VRREDDNAHYLLVVKPDYQAELIDIPIKIPRHMEQVRPPSRCVCVSCTAESMQ
jgi:hypothetical protein